MRVRGNKGLIKAICNLLVIGEKSVTVPARALSFPDTMTALLDFRQTGRLEQTKEDIQH